MKRLIIAVSVLLIIMIASLLFLPSFINWDAHKETIVNKLETASGYDINIAGKLSFSVLPFPHLSIEDLSVINPSSEIQDYKVLSLKKADVQLDLFPLIRKEIVISKIRLIRPELELIINKSGDPLWQTTKLKQIITSSQNDKQSNKPNELIDTIKMNEIEIDSGLFRLKNYKLNKVFTVENIEQIIKGESLFGPYDVEGSVSYEGKVINTKITSGRADNTKSIAITTNINIPSLSTTVTYSGVLDYSKDYGVLGETVIKTDDLGELIKTFYPINSSYNLAHNLSVNGLLEYSSKGFSFKNFSLNLPSFEAKGLVQLLNPAEKGSPFTLKFDLASDSTLNLNRYIKGKSKASLKTFIPETISVPLNVNAKGRLKIGALQFRDTIYKYLDTEVAVQDFKVKTRTKVQVGEHTNLVNETNVKFNSQSKSNTNITLSDPVISSSFKLKSNNIYKSIKSLYTKDTFDKHKALIDQEGESQFIVTVFPSNVKVTEGNITLNKGKVEFSFDYLKKSVRDLLQVNIDIQDFKLPEELGKSEDANKNSFDIENIINIYSKVPVDLDLRAVLRNVNLLNLSIKSSKIKALLKEQSVQIEHFDLEDVDSSALSFSGSIQDVSSLSGIKADVGLRTSDLEQFLSKIGMNFKNNITVGKLALQSEFTGNKSKVNFLSHIDALGGKAKLKGALLNPFHSLEATDLAVTISHPDLKMASQKLGLNVFNHIESNREVSVSTVLDYSPAKINFNDINATIGRVSFSGSLSADTTNEKPYVNADLNFGNLPLDEVLGHRFSKNKAPKDTKTNKSTTVNNRWSEDPVKMDWMDDINFDIKSKCKKFKYGNWVITNADLSMRLSDGTLNIGKLNGDFHDGNIVFQGNLVKKPRVKEISVEADITANDITLESFVNSFSGSNVLKTKGKISLETAVGAKGDTPYALISSVNGKGLSNGSNLIFEGFDLAKLSRVLSSPSSSMSKNFGTILNGTMAGGVTHFEKMNSNFVINNGVINFNNIDFFGPDASIKSIGTLSLPLWSIDLKSSIKLVEPPDSPALEVSIKGPLDKPMQTFGKSAMDTYFNSQFNNLIEQTLIKKLQDKGVLSSPPVNDNQVSPQDPSGQNLTESPELNNKQKRKEPEPEDILRGLLQGIIEN